jgi:hypothetical protein
MPKKYMLPPPQKTRSASIWLYMLCGCVVLFAVAYFIPPYLLTRDIRGEDFDSAKWKATPHGECRARMVHDLLENHLLVTHDREQIEALLGKPACSPEGVYLYSLGNCRDKEKNWGGLVIVFDGKTVEEAKVSWFIASGSLPSNEAPTWLEMNGPTKDDAMRRIRNISDYEQDDMGVRYTVNQNQELLAIAPNARDRASFVANFRNGIAGICLLSLKEE